MRHLLCVYKQYNDKKLKQKKKNTRNYKEYKYEKQKKKLWAIKFWGPSGYYYCYCYCCATYSKQYIDYIQRNLTRGPWRTFWTCMIKKTSFKKNGVGFAFSSKLRRFTICFSPGNNHINPTFWKLFTLSGSLTVNLVPTNYNVTITDPKKTVILWS